jgi:predicted acyl esterase
VVTTSWSGAIGRYHAGEARVEERHDVLVYTSAHLITPVAIAGPVLVRLTAATSARDTDFTAKLVDVEPDGYCATSPRDHPLPPP